MASKPKNGVGGWIVIAVLCLGGSTGGTIGGSYLRKPPPHNPDITTEAWITMTVTVDRLDREMTKLSSDVREALRRLPRQQRQPPP